MGRRERISLFDSALGLYARSWKTQFVIYGAVFLVALAAALISDLWMGMPQAQVVTLVVVVVIALLLLAPVGYAMAAALLRGDKGLRRRPTHPLDAALGEAAASSNDEAENGVNTQMQTSHSDADDQAVNTLVEKDRRFRESLQPRLTLIVSIAALMFSLLTLIGGAEHGLNIWLQWIRDHIKLIIIFSNITVSLFAFYFLARQKADDFIIQDKEKFRSLAELHTGVDIQIYTTNLNNRVAKSVNQFRLHMTLFAFSLVLIYGVLFLGALYSSDELNAEALPGSVKLSEPETKPADAQVVAPEQPKPEPPPNFVLQKSFRKINYFPIVTNLINLLGALFVQLGFSVLYGKTLDAQTVQEVNRGRASAAKDQYSLETTQYITYNSSLYWGVPLMLFVLYALIFISLSVAYLGNSDFVAVTRFLNIADLIAGSANGLAMSLLFGRYASIERDIGETKSFKTVFDNIFYPFSSLPYKALVSVGIVFVLPIYALAQPLFGSLKIDAFGDPDNFETIVFAVCLLGKICFLHLTYILISKKLLHLYLYGLVSKVGNFRELENCFGPTPQQEVLS